MKYNGMMEERAPVVYSISESVKPLIPGQLSVYCIQYTIGYLCSHCPVIGQTVSVLCCHWIEYL